jgi:hypothetical protein
MAGLVLKLNIIAAIGRFIMLIVSMSGISRNKEKSPNGNITLLIKNRLAKK